MTVRKKISISFHNFWGGFEPEKSYFVRALGERFDVKIDKFGSDIEFYSVFGANFSDEVLRSKALKVWFTGEAQDPKNLIYDLYFNFRANSLLGRRSIRLPLWATNIDWWGNKGPLTIGNLTKPRSFERRAKFCNFIYSNSVSLRNEMFYRLNQEQRVDSYGKVLNNMGFRAGDKLQLLRDYRFTIAFENFSSKGYVTEKLLEPLASGSVPIYWGASEAQVDFNPAAFINASSFESMDALIKRILEIDQDDDALRQMAEAPVFAASIPYEMTPRYFADRIEECLDTASMRGHGEDLNMRLAERRNLKGRIRIGWRKAIRGLRI